MTVVIADSSPLNYLTLIGSVDAHSHDICASRGMAKPIRQAQPRLDLVPTARHWARHLLSVVCGDCLA